MNRFTFNGIRYAITSALIPSYSQKEDKLERGQRTLYHFSLAICDPRTGRKQHSLQNLSLVETTSSSGEIYLSIRSPQTESMRGVTQVISFLPGVKDPIQNRDRRELIHKLVPLLEKYAKESLTKRSTGVYPPDNQ